MTFKPGDKVRCIDAKEPGIPIYEGEIYTVSHYIPAPHGIGAEGDGGQRENTAHIPAVMVAEVPGAVFMETRFRKARVQTP